MIPSHLLDPLAALLTVGHQCTMEGILENKANIIFFFLFSEEHTNHHSIPEPDGPGGLCGPLRITLDFLEFIYRAVPLSSLKE